MIIQLNQSKLFTTDPAKRFAWEHKVSEDIWRELWRRHKLLEYDTSELCELFYIKVGCSISRRVMNRWIFRGEIYMKARPMMDKGVQAVNSAFFGDLEQRVINEIMKHLKTGDSKNTRIMA